MTKKMRISFSGREVAVEFGSNFGSLRPEVLGWGPLRHFVLMRMVGQETNDAGKAFTGMLWPPVSRFSSGGKPLDRAFAIVPIRGLAANFLKTMADYPPSQTPGSFNLSAIEKQLSQGAGSR